MWLRSLRPPPLALGSDTVTASYTGITRHEDNYNAVRAYDLATLTNQDLPQTLLAINYNGKDLQIAFNPAYLIDPLNVLTEVEVFLELIDELSPGVLKINGPFLYVVMPMRLS